MGQKRLFLGGLFPDVTEDDLKDRFVRFGKIGSIEIKKKTDIDGAQKTFAYLDMEAEDRDYQKCFTTFNRSKWKGSELTVQFAKENFITRLQTEREASIEEQNRVEPPVEEKPVVVNRLNDIAGVHNFHMKGAVPGTAIPGEQEWIVAKYGRVLPVMNIKTRGSRKMVKIDPSKFTHNVKKISTDIDSTVDPSKLTWQLKFDEETEITKKRKGQFPDWKPKKVVRKTVRDRDTARNKDNSDSEEENRTDEISNHREINSHQAVAKQMDPSWLFHDSDSDIEMYTRYGRVQNTFQNANAKTLENDTLGNDLDIAMEVVPVMNKYTQPSSITKQTTLPVTVPQSSLMDLSRFDSDSDSEATSTGQQLNVAVFPERKSVTGKTVPYSETGLIKQPDMSRFDSDVEDEDDDVGYKCDNGSSMFSAAVKGHNVTAVEKPVRSGNVSQQFTATNTEDRNTNKQAQTRLENKDLPKQKAQRIDQKKNKGKWTLQEFKGTGSLSGTKEKELNVGTASLKPLTSPEHEVERSHAKSDGSLENKLAAYINQLPSSPKDMKSGVAQSGRTEDHRAGRVSVERDTSQKDVDKEVSDGEDASESEASSSDDNTDDSSSVDIKHKDLIKGKAERPIINDITDSIDDSDDIDDDSDDDDDDDDDDDSDDEEEASEAEISGSGENSCDSSSVDFKQKEMIKSKADTVGPITYKVSDDSDDDDSEEDSDDDDNDSEEEDSGDDDNDSEEEDSGDDDDDSEEEYKENKHTLKNVSRNSTVKVDNEIHRLKKSEYVNKVSNTNAVKPVTIMDGLDDDSSSEEAASDAPDSSSDDTESSSESDTDDAVTSKYSELTTTNQGDSSDDCTSDTEDSDFENLVAKEMEKIDSVKINSSAIGKSPQPVVKPSLQHVKKGKDVQGTSVNTHKSTNDGKDKSVFEQRKIKSDIANVKDSPTLNERGKTPRLPPKQSVLPEATDKVAVELKRQQAVQKLHKGHLAKVSVIQKALSNLDNAVPSKNKITFDSDSEQEVARPSKEVSVSTIAAHAQSGMVAPPPETRKRTKALFDSSSDDSEPEDDALFNIPTQFEGAGGSKLLKLQSRYGNDERFKLDSRFVESGSEDEEQQTVPEEDERTRSLKILQSVVGAKVNLHLEKKKKFKDMSILKYDPSKEDHSQYEIKTKPKARTPVKQDSKKKKLEAGEEDVVTPVIPEVGRERFFQVSQSIKDAFVKAAVAPEETSSQGFSMLAAFGRDEDVEEEQSERNAFPVSAAIPISESVHRDRMSLDDRFRVADDDSSDNERESDEHMEEEDGLKKNDKEASRKTSGTSVETAQKATSSFFFTQNDDRLKEGEKFYRTQDLQTVTDKWLEQRQQYSQKYKQKHKNLCRKLRTNQSSQHTRNQRGGRGRKRLMRGAKR